MQSTTPGPFLSPFQGSFSFSSLTPGGASLARGYCLARLRRGGWSPAQEGIAAAGALPRSLDRGGWNPAQEPGSRLLEPCPGAWIAAAGALPRSLDRGCWNPAQEGQ